MRGFILGAALTAAGVVIALITVIGRGLDALSKQEDLDDTTED